MLRLVTLVLMRRCPSNRTTATKMHRVNCLWTPLKFWSTADICQRDCTRPSIQMACFASVRQARPGSHYENKWQGFKITEPKFGRTNVITSHYGQTNLNGWCYGQPCWVCKPPREICRYSPTIPTQVFGFINDKIDKIDKIKVSYRPLCDDSILNNASKQRFYLSYHVPKKRWDVI